ncbi:MAG TPA: thioredoxin fold domain-containing protein, partial [Usitatibacter sp.]|nr:thioredoxin fold domain-containing protein [Usitatibacter sp.]
MDDRLPRRRFDPLPALAALVFGLCLLVPGLARAADPIEIPPWFTETFLDFRDDVRDAAQERKRVIVYFGQDGCPYCKALMKAGFGDPSIAAYTREHFVAIALNIWGDRETTWQDGRTLPEKKLAQALRVQFTPTLLFLDEAGNVALRLDGYPPPDRLRTALEYVAGREEKQVAYADYVARRSATAAAEKHAREPFLEPFPVDVPQLLARGRPVLVVVERAGCGECTELHRDAFARADIRQLLAKFSVVAIDTAGEGRVALPDGSSIEERLWARLLGAVYAPTMVFLGTDGR